MSSIQTPATDDEDELPPTPVERRPVLASASGTATPASPDIPATPASAEPTSAANSPALSMTTTASASATPSEKTTKTKQGKKRKRDMTELFEEQLKALNNNDDDDEFSRFGEEVAAELRKFTDPYKQAVTMRGIRDCIFFNLYNTQSQSAPTAHHHLPTPTTSTFAAAHPYPIPNPTIPTSPPDIAPTQYHYSIPDDPEYYDMG